MIDEFRWNEWNVNHIDEHGIATKEAEYVVNHAGRGYPRQGRNETLVVHGQTAAGEYLQVVFVIDPAPATTIYVIHARPLNTTEKRRKRKRR